MQKRSFHRYLLFSLLLSLSASLLAGMLIYAYTKWSGLQTLTTDTRRRAAYYANNLEREIDRYGLVPLTAALNHEIVDYLQHRPNARSTDRINRYLKSLNDSVGAERTYLIDPEGTIIASSNWDGTDSFLGHNVSYRPYFQEARRGKVSRYYGIGTTGNASGYYQATAVEEDGRRLAVVAVKIDLEQLERLWLSASTPIVLSDANGVVILSSRPQWKYGVIGPWGSEVQRRADASQQYNMHPLHRLHWREEQRLDRDSQLVEILEGSTTKRYLSVSQDLSYPSMQLTVLVTPGPVYALALARGFAAALLVAFAMVVLHALNQWRLSLRERLSAQAELQTAHDRLEELVEQRSTELRIANEGLKREIAERVQAARQVESFQQELIRTENLAVIGQLSAGLAHEINQPLAAIATLAANAVRFLERGDTETVSFNLERITSLVSRMGAISGQLRSFARRSNGEFTEVALATSIDNALALLEHQLEKTQRPIAVLRRPPPQPVEAYCDALRLEQVLVNLISNAIDAIAEVPHPQIVVAWEQDDAYVRIIVEDNGIGLSEDIRARLFEPFFTTKTHSGLGLGLAISTDIVKSFGGSLYGSNADPGPGTRFTVELPHPSTRNSSAT